MHKTIATILLSLLFSCTSTKIASPELTSAHLTAVKSIVIYCENTYLRDGIDLESRGAITVTNDKTKANVVLNCKETTNIDRSVNYKILGNILTLCVGYFYFSFDIDSQFTWEIEIEDKSGTFNHTSTDTHQYSQPGYLPLYKEGLERKNIFYQDLFDSERASLGSITGKELIIKLSQRLTH
jgi:hypothetical protein